MINSEIILLCWTAASIGFIHTALGPDHYLPFVMMGKVRNWSIAKTSWVTLLCGSGHVLSSVVLGLLGVYLGTEVLKLEALEAYRGTIAAWLLISFGFAYFIWGIHKAIKNKKHSHVHLHGTGLVHDHPHYILLNMHMCMTINLLLKTLHPGSYLQSLYLVLVNL